MTRCRLLVLLALLLVAGFAPAPAWAEDEIAITATVHENSYPAQIKFSIAAQSSSEITRVVLRSKRLYNQVSSTSNAEFTPGTSVQATYAWNTQRQYVPPGIELEYYWQVENAAGRTAQSAATNLTIDDTRFEWQSASAGRLSLFWYKGDQRFAKDLLDAGTRAVRQFGDEVGVALEQPVKLFVYETQQDLLGALPPRDVEWTGGAAFAEAGIILLNAAPNARGRDYGLRTVPHELSHLMVHAATDNPFGDVPRWLDEGLAMYAEGELEASFADALRRAVSDDKLLSLRSLSGRFPTDRDQALLSYAQSHSIVKYLLSTYGRDKMSRLLAAFREGATSDSALRQAFGSDAAGIERAWRGSINASVPPASARPAPSQTGGRIAEPAPTAVATPTPATAPAGGGSCFGGLLTMASAIGGLFLVAGRIRT